MTAAADSFWSKVDRSGDCWLWMGARRPGGYGNFGVRGRTVGAHRYAYELTNGPIPEGLFALHHCDNPPCVRPDHLFLGTAADNTHDMMEKGRKVDRPLRGEANGRAVLRADDVIEIRRLRASGESVVTLAGQFGVTPSMVSHITTRRAWAHVR